MPLIAASLEGVISSIDPDGTGAVLVVMGVTVVVDRQVAVHHKIRSPTAKPTIEQLVNTAPLRGRTEPGFVGGTAKLQGNFNTDTRKLEIKYLPSVPANQGGVPFQQHPSIAVGPAESVLAGPITQNSGGVLAVDRVLVKLLDQTDARFPGNPPTNEFGFEIKLETVAENVPATVKGFFSKPEAAFLGYDFLINGPADLTTNAPQVSITKAQGRNRGAEFDLNLRGGVTTSDVVGNQQVRLDIYRIDSVTVNGVETDLPSTVRLGSATARIIPGGFSKWNFNARITALPPPLDRAPEKVLVRNVTTGGGAFKVGEVEILKE